MRTLGSALTIVTAALATSASLSADVGQPQHLDAQIAVKMDYLLYLPKDYASKERWPVLLFLHGAGERGSDLNQVKVHGPPKVLESGAVTPCSEFIVVAPQCGLAKSFWRPEELIALLDEVQAKHKADPDRIYVTGLSMGGYGTWSLVTLYPDRFAAAAPICGGGTAILTRFANLKGFPAWAFHGAKDPVVPLKESEEMVEALKAAEGDARLTVYPEVEHDSWTATYADPELYRWLLSHKRSDRPAAPRP